MKKLAILALLLIPPPARAGATRADYERADGLANRFRDKVVRATVRPHWLDGERFWYRNDLADGIREYVFVDAGEGERRPAFDHARLAAALAGATGRPHDPKRLAVDKLAVDEGGIIGLAVAGKGWRFDPASGELKAADAPADEAAAPTRNDRPSGRRGGSRRGEDSPDGKWSVLIRDDDVVLKEKATGTETPLSFEGRESDRYEPGVFWAPDSSHFVALRAAKGDDRKVYLIESSPKDQVQPKLDSYDYLKPGDRVPVSRPHLFDVAARAEVPIDDALFPNPWSLDPPRWAPDSSRFTFVYNQRGHQVLRLIAVDAADGAARAIVDERSPTFIDYAHKQFLHYFDDKDEILWMSERSGWNQLYLIDAKTGAAKNAVTQGEFVIRGVDRVDESARQVWFRVAGIRKDEDPYHVHHARADLDGSNLVVLTEGDGTHDVQFSPDRTFLIDTYSRVDLPPVTELRRAKDGSLVCGLERADASALESAGWRAPERFQAKGRDGRTDIYGVIFRPSTFDPAQKYPVVEQVYAGPQGSFAPVAFAAFHPPQALAELGFVVVQADGMGTNWRSKAFHDVCWKDLADAGFPDRIAWLKAAAEKYPALDLARVGIYGGSAGGQNALGGLLFHGDFYRAAVADCGCHDNRMDKVWWNELWMGWPVGPHYAAQSNVTNAHRLKGKLLLTVGELDRNVDPASTMQVVDALIKANKDFELIVFPGAGHGAGGSRYGRRRQRDFFVRHLQGAQPPDWNEGE